MMKTIPTIIIRKRYKEILQRDDYEEIILKVINESKALFPHKYERIKDQSNNQADFIDLETNEFYDAKSIVNNELCQKLHINEVGDWVLDAEEYINNSWDTAITGDNVCSNEMYIKIKEGLKKLNSKENGILFYPFPVIEFESSLVASLMFNNIQMIYKHLSNNFIKKNCKKLFVIYPCIENKMVILDLIENAKEFVNINIEDYIETLNIEIKK